jgi:hypothetical protein
MINDDVRPYVNATIRLLNKNDLENANKALNHINNLIGKANDQEKAK